MCHSPSMDQCYRNHRPLNKTSDRVHRPPGTIDEHLTGLRIEITPRNLEGDIRFAQSGLEQSRGHPSYVMKRDEDAMDEKRVA